MTQGIWAEVALDGPFGLVLGAPHFWADPAVPVARAALAARSICLGFQRSAPQWLSSRLNKVGVIRGKYFSVAHMNGPLYSRPLNCISMGFDRAYQELLKDSVAKKNRPASTNYLNAVCFFLVTIPHKTILNPVLSPLIPQLGYLARTHFSSVLGSLKVLSVITGRGDAIKNALCVTARRKKKNLFSDERKPHRLHLELFQSGHLRPKNIKDLSTVQGQR